VIDSSVYEHISVTDILRNLALSANHNCIPGTGKCGTPSSNLAKGLGGDFDLASDFVESTESWRKVFATCEKVRNAASVQGLSAIDAFLARWAIVHKGHLMDILRSYQHGDESIYKKAIQEAKIPGVSDPSKLCWDWTQNGDQEKLDAIAKVMGKVFVVK